MSRSKGRSTAPSSSGAGKRLQTIGLFGLLLVVAGLVGSLVAGVMGGQRGGAGDGVAADSGRAPSERAAARSDVPRPTERVRVEVLNASGVPGLARRGTEALRDVGFDVVNYGNAPGFAPDSSLVLDRVGRMELARSVADAIQVPRVYARPDSNVYVDVTVVLGRDWAAENADPPAEEPAPEEAP
ncbi:LytR C-terminal domain-containing protein [Longimicrobium sp.]|uniref:LytR C-terminal domain-containing protein n=1 Tax=Longimicrobium sp. TaxID=2029185 RepID=UPI002E338085|nr:LytR C-terminal domain-containing protein [Longimicrobium sp.]HEX6039089.1 LytR C-terminal domain-containing protein [Longimicrobium sp.]